MVKPPSRKTPPSALHPPKFLVNTRNRSLAEHFGRFCRFLETKEGDGSGRGGVEHAGSAGGVVVDKRHFVKKIVVARKRITGSLAGSNAENYIPTPYDRRNDRRPIA
jgi:hypothetical protein